MQINRLFEMIYLLLDRERMTAGELAQHFEVSPRTIYRDVELLSSAEIPIYMTKGKGGGISLLPDFILNKTVLTDNEKSDVLSALNAVQAVSLEQTNTAVSKLSSLFGKTNADWVEVDFSQWANADEESRIFHILKNSILEKCRIEFQYSSSKGSDTVRAVEPLKLCFKGQGWYLYAYCTLREDYRFFKLSRIKELRILNEQFNRVPPDRIFDNTHSFPDTFITVVMKVSKEMAYRVYDEFSQYDVLPNGDFQVHFTMPNGVWLHYYLATFGEHCEILEPESIRQEVKNKLQKTLNKYL